MLLDEQRIVIEKAAREQGFQNFSISVEEGSKKGDNYLGNISLITVRENDSNKEKSYILKCADTNPDVRAQMPVHEAYQREIYMYQTVLPTFKNFQEKSLIKHPFKAFTNLFGSSIEEGNEYLLMENIKSVGFSMLDRKKTMDDEHVSLVFRELAKLHSVSLAMKSLEPEIYKNVAENTKDYFLKYKDIMKSFAENAEKKIKSALTITEGNQKAKEALANYSKDLFKLYEDLKNENHHLVILHGDPWCNNMMFKYEDHKNPTKPTSMCFLDWQISRTMSPVADLAYYFFLSASKPILDNHQKYLNLYYQTIDENLQSVGCDINSVFPYDLFQEHWRTFSKMGVLTAFGNLQIMLKDEKDVKNFADMVEGGGIILDQFWQEEEFSEQYCQRIRDIVFMMVENGYM